MFTNNYIELQKAAFMGSSTYLTAADATKFTFYAYDANNGLELTGLGRWLYVGRCKTISGVTSSTSSSAINNTSVGGVWFGTSSTPATKDDYALGNAITSGLTVTSPLSTTQKHDGDEKYTFLSDFIVRNDTEADINICEIGLFTTPVVSGKAYNVLMEHTVLDEPVTIPAGESRLITYKVTFNQS